ncbi:hypothetical protein FN846DRAFT_904949 [Sphaerosporella brunnea]|uniref:Inhibitor I9 domain-containing protein n=1 Tax=Sphaerosporella brunnea TaxID=1250544 RepID=A0A5J5F343_9PEZI|nr:hypothetical protein FN846DRAFT_904949 [Sphaerosporella brunnea]
MPTYIITAKKSDDKEKLMEEAIAQGGTITHDYTLIPAFAVAFPEGNIQAFECNPNVASVEEDGVVTTQ